MTSRQGLDLWLYVQTGEVDRASLHLPHMTLSEGQLLPDAGPAVTRLFDLWQTLAAKKGRLPARKDILPVHLAKVLPAISMNDVHYDKQGALADLTMRISGTRVSSYFSEITGKSVRCIPSEESIARVFDFSRRVIESRKPLHARLCGCNQEDIPFELQTLYCPLSSDGGRVDIIIHAMDTWRKDEERAAPTG